MMLVWAVEYSAAPCPSRRRAAPAMLRRLSRAKGTSPSCASLIGFPALRDSTREISSARPSSASAIFQRKAARPPGLRCAQSEKPRCAAAPARFTSSFPAVGTLAMTSSVEGSITFVRASAAASTHAPPMNISYRIMPLPPRTKSSRASRSSRPWLSRPGGQGLFQGVQPPSQVFVRNHQRHQDADDVIVDARFQDEQAPFQAGGQHLRRRRLCRGLALPVLHEFHADHRAQAAHVPDDGEAPLHRLETGKHVHPNGLGPFKKPFALHHVDHGQRRAAARRPGISRRPAGPVPRRHAPPRRSAPSAQTPSAPHRRRAGCRGAGRGPRARGGSPEGVRLSPPVLQKNSAKVLAIVVYEYPLMVVLRGIATVRLK